MISRSLPPVLAAATLLVSVAHATVRCRTGDGRIYIGASPPAGCEVEATYGTSPAEGTPTKPATPISPPDRRATPVRRTTVTAAPTPTPAAGITPRRSPARREAADSPARKKRSPARTVAPSGAPGALAAKRASLERALGAVGLELERIERELEERRVEDAPGPGHGEPARLRAEAERRRRLEPLRRRQGELRSRRDRIRAEFAELTSRVAVANGGALPAWWPAELRCGRCPPGDARN